MLARSTADAVGCFSPRRGVARARGRLAPRAAAGAARDAGVDGASSRRKLRVALAPPRRPTARRGGARPRRSSARGDVETADRPRAPPATREVEVVAVPDASPSDSPQGSHPERASSFAPRATLLLVPLLWATYNPALSFIYESDAPPSPAELTAVRMLVSLVPFSFVLEDVARDEARKREAAAKETSLAGDETDPTSSSRDVSLLLRAGLELGLVNAAATAFQAYGLELTSATRAGFLLSTINVAVPLGAAAAGQRVSKVTWIAVALAAVGVAVTEGAFTPDALDAAASVPATGASSLGDACCLAAAALYSAFTVRLGVHARRCDAAELSACKAAHGGGVRGVVGGGVNGGVGGVQRGPQRSVRFRAGGSGWCGARWYTARSRPGRWRTSSRLKDKPPCPQRRRSSCSPPRPCSTPRWRPHFWGSARRSRRSWGG